MEQQGKQLKDMSVVELKALAYDLILQREQNGQQLQIVNQEIVEAMKKLKPMETATKE